MERVHCKGAQIVGDTYSGSNGEEVNCSLAVTSIALRGDRDVHVTPPDFLNDKEHSKYRVKVVTKQFGRLTSLVISSRTTLLSLGVRPVFWPELTERAPVSATVVG
jgi:hypothetical protein